LPRKKAISLESFLFGSLDRKIKTCTLFAIFIGSGGTSVSSGQKESWEKDEGRKSRQSDALILITLLRGRMTIPLREWFALSITKRSVDHGAKTDQ
jgi:hypothetical protein